MPGILALDLSTFTGWAYIADPVDVGLEPEYGSFRMPKTGSDIGKYLRAYRLTLEPMLRKMTPDHVVFESPIMPGTTQIATVRKLYSLAGVTEMLSLDQADRQNHPLVCSEAYMQRVRKHFCGHARPCAKGAKGQEAKKQIKQAVIEACWKRGWQPQNDNEADALAVMDFARATLYPETANEGLPLLEGAQ